jgi:hypothetical protein
MHNHCFKTCLDSTLPGDLDPCSPEKRDEIKACVRESMPYKIATMYNAIDVLIDMLIEKSLDDSLKVYRTCRAYMVENKIAWSDIALEKQNELLAVKQ